MRLYAGFDLHAGNNFLGIIDEIEAMLATVGRFQKTAPTTSFKPLAPAQSAGESIFSEFPGAITITPPLHIGSKMSLTGSTKTAKLIPV